MSVEVRAFPVRSPRFGHSATLMDDGRVLVGGGFTSVANSNVITPVPINTFQIYDPETDSWLLLAKDVIPSFGSGALRLSDGRYLSVGISASRKGLEGTAGILDPENLLWAILPPPPEARGFPALTMLQKGRVLLLSGLAPSDSDAYCACVHQGHRDPGSGNRYMETGCPHEHCRRYSDSRVARRRSSNGPAGRLFRCGNLRSCLRFMDRHFAF